MLKVTAATVEYAVDPVGLETLSPRIAWLTEAERAGVRQTAYRILVSADRKALDADAGEEWDTGRTEGSRSMQIPYEGKPLMSRKRYYFKIRVWDEDGSPSPWSGVFFWEMGLLHPEDWQAVWIAAPMRSARGTDPGAASGDAAPLEATTPAPMFRKTFETAGAVRKATAYVCGLGCHEWLLNGERIGDRVLEPSQTDYSRSVLYSVYEVTDQLRRARPGSAQTIIVTLGRGMYAMRTRSVWGWERASWVRPPQLLFQLEIDYEDGTSARLISDSTWLCADSATLADCWYIGETYDARREGSGRDGSACAGAGWEPAAFVPAPSGRLKSGASLPPMRVTGQRLPIGVIRTPEGRLLADFGAIVTGWVRIAFRGERGSIVCIRYAEQLDAAGRVVMRQDDIDGEIQCDVYIAKGEGREIWEPRFGYKSFRYAEIEGWAEEPGPDDLHACIVHHALKEAGSFECGDPLLNAIHACARAAILNNLHGIPTDTPAFEKNGWTGDAMESAEAAMLNWQMAGFYAKWLDDLSESQQADGELPPIVPSPGWGLTDDPEGWDLVKGPVPPWDAALFLICRWMYDYYGDLPILNRHYGTMKRYLAYLRERAPEHRFGGGLGEWLAPSGDPRHRADPADHSVELVATAYYYKMAATLAEIAELLGRAAESEAYAALAEDIAAQFERRFYRPDLGYYESAPGDGFRQTNQILPLAFGLAPPEREPGLARRLAEDIARRDGSLDTGIFGTKYLLHVLTDHGYEDAAYRVVSRRTYPGWGFWIERGATSMWETWETNARSLNHHMFASVDDWFYKGLAGIRPEEPGFRKIRFKPAMPSGLAYARACVETASGTVRLHWQRTPSHWEIEIEVPAHSRAELILPQALSGCPVHGRSAGLEPVREVLGGVYTAAFGIHRIHGGFPA